ncbi:hypothetical protein M9Y10_001942 [Tritrichomonas musculus]|uniref:Uncharacterized protein n=1 Tax=Tritrichomonas musculus TaxID=1915356 RepID=A0ABR2L9D1_9EUKA
MNPPEALANVMMANFEATRLEQIRMLVELTDNYQYRQFLETKNNPKIVQILKDQRDTLLNEEHKSFSDVLLKVKNENTDQIMKEIELIDSRKEVDDYLISKYASIELQNQIKAVAFENSTMNDEIDRIRQKNRGKL